MNTRMRALIFSLLILFWLVVPVMAQQSLVVQPRAPVYKGVLWNSMATGLKDRLIIRFSRKLHQGKLAPLVNAYVATPSNILLAGVPAYFGKGTYSIESSTPIFLNIESGQIIDEKSQILGVSYFQLSHPLFDEGFAFIGNKISILESEQRLVIHP